MSYFDYAAGLRMTNDKFHRLFGRPNRSPETDIEQFQMDVAASIQKVTEEVVLRTVRFAHETTGKKNLCLAGGVALNCVGNGRILREGPFENIWIQPAAGDAGRRARLRRYMVWYHLLEEPARGEQPLDAQRGEPPRPGLRATTRSARSLDRAGRPVRGVPGRGRSLTQRVAQL